MGALYTWKVCSAREVEGFERTTPERFKLRFPSEWIPPVELNPYSRLIEEKTIDWMREHKLLTSDATARQVREFDVGGYGGYAMPLANYERCTEFTRFVALWLLWDDVEVEVIVDEWEEEIESYERLIVGSSAEPHGRSGFAPVWWGLFRQIAQSRSRGWLRRISRSMKSWLRFTQSETRRAKEYVKLGRMPALSEIIRYREVTIGMGPTLYLVEHVEGFELPESFHENETVMELKRMSARIVAFGNDLCGMAKDLQNKWPTPLTVLIHEHGGNPIPAVTEAVEMHNDTVARFDALAKRLPSFGWADDILVREWLRAVRHLCRGFTLWESRSMRYQKDKVVYNGKVIDISV